MGALASATFRLAGGEEFELHLKPGTGTGFLGVQNVSVTASTRPRFARRMALALSRCPPASQCSLQHGGMPRPSRRVTTARWKGLLSRLPARRCAAVNSHPKLSLSPHLVCKRDGRQVVGRRRFSSRSRSDRTENGLLLSRLAGMLRMCALVRCAAVQAVAVVVCL